MKDKNIIPTQKGIVSIKSEPNLILTSTCPYCKNENWDYIENSEKNKTVLNSCVECDADYYINIPKFKNLKK